MKCVFVTSFSRQELLSLRRIVPPGQGLALRYSAKHLIPSVQIQEQIDFRLPFDASSDLRWMFNFPETLCQYFFTVG